MYDFIVYVYINFLNKLVLNNCVVCNRSEDGTAFSSAIGANDDSFVVPGISSCELSGGRFLNGGFLSLSNGSLFLGSVHAGIVDSVFLDLDVFVVHSLVERETKHFEADLALVEVVDMVVGDAVDGVHILVLEVVRGRSTGALFSVVLFVRFVLHGIRAEDVGTQIVREVAAFVDANLEVELFAQHVFGLIYILKCIAIFIDLPVASVFHHDIVLEFDLSVVSSFTFNIHDLACVLSSHAVE